MVRIEALLLAVATASYADGRDSRLLQLDHPCSEEEVPQAITAWNSELAGRTWFGLWKIDREYWLKPAPLRAVRRRQLLPLEDGPGIQLSPASPKRGELLFYVSEEGLREGIVESVIPDDAFLDLNDYLVLASVPFPGYGDSDRLGEPLTLHFRDQTYAFRIATVPQPNYYEPDPSRFLPRLLVEKSSPPGFSSASYTGTETVRIGSPDVLWAGDYNRDGQMDVFFEMGFGDSQVGEMLMAGEAHGTEHPFRIVGAHMHVDCC